MKSSEVTQYIGKVIFTELKSNDNSGLEVYVLGKLYDIDGTNFLLVSQEEESYRAYYAQRNEFQSIDLAPPDLCPWTNESFDLITSTLDEDWIKSFHLLFGKSIHSVVLGNYNQKTSKDGLEINDDGTLANPTPGFEFL